jgi:protease-4
LGDSGNTAIARAIAGDDWCKGVSMDNDQRPQSEVILAQAVPVERKPPRRTGLRLLAFFVLVGLPLSCLLLMIFGGLADMAGLGGGSSSVEEERYQERIWKGPDKIAIIRVEGPILDGDGYVRDQIDAVLDDDKVRAVVLRIDSPGGTVTGSDYILHHLKKMRAEKATQGKKLPLVVSMGGIAASGGYYIAMAVEETPNAIFAEPTTWTGSIGVIIPHYDISGLLKRYNVEDNSIVSHELKALGSMTKEMTPEERAILQGLVDDSFERFKQIVLSGRPKLSNPQLQAAATGQVFTTRQAIEHGLVDREGFLEDAIRAAISMAGLTDDDVRVVRYKGTPSLTDLLFMRAGRPKPDPLAILDAATPRAYYLWTWLPGLAPQRPAAQ